MIQRKWHLRIHTRVCFIFCNHKSTYSLFFILQRCRDSPFSRKLDLWSFLGRLHRIASHKLLFQLLGRNFRCLSTFHFSSSLVNITIVLTEVALCSQGVLSFFCSLSLLSQRWKKAPLRCFPISNLFQYKELTTTFKKANFTFLHSACNSFDAGRPLKILLIRKSCL